MWYPSLMSKPFIMARHRSEAANSRAENRRVPHLGMDLLPVRASEMSRNSSLPFLGTVPLGSMMVGSEWPGRMASVAPWK
jgi:hypothetical protein